MSKKTAKKRREILPEEARKNHAASVSALNREGEGVKPLALWGLSAILIVSGYALLHKVDPGGQNAWAILSPALLLCGYLLIIPAIVYTYRS